MDDTSNLLKETIKILEQNNKTIKDVLWVGSKDLWFTWEHFESIADIEYGPGYGHNEIVHDLIVVGDNWWLERYVYDGKEWWVFKTLPPKPLQQINVKGV